MRHSVLRALTLVLSLIAITSSKTPGQDRARLDKAEAEFASWWMPLASRPSAVPCGVRIGPVCVDLHEFPEWDWGHARSGIGLKRMQLIALLDTLVAAAPADGVLTGQRIRHLVDAGLFGRAIHVASECQAEPWWCAALSGYALWHERLIVEAEAAFDRALTTMPYDRRCNWTNLEKLLDRTEAAIYPSNCQARDSLNARIWWLADPLFLVPGNERRAAHFARLVGNELRRGRPFPLFSTWGGPLEEMLLRFGEPDHWAFADGHAHYTGSHYHFLSILGVALDPGSAAFDSWDLDQWNRMTPERLQTAIPFHTLDLQAALFRRGDSTLLVTGADIPDELGTGAPTAALLLASNEAQGLNRFNIGSLRARLIVLQRFLAPAPTLLSLEILAPGKRAARGRAGLRDTQVNRGGFGVSDLLLFMPGAMPPRTLDEATTIMHTRSRLTAANSVGVFWEIYGVSEARKPRIAISFKPDDMKTEPLRMEWQDEEWSRAAIQSRAVVVKTSDLKPGKYTVTMTVSLPGEAPAITSRRFEFLR